MTRPYDFTWDIENAFKCAQLLPSKQLSIIREIDDDFADFLDEQMPKLNQLSLEPSVLDHVLDQEPIYEGLVLEFGVFTGSSINRIASAMPARMVFGFDSFEGLPENWENFPKTVFKRSPPEVKPNVLLVEGWFNDTLPAFLETTPDPIALVHLDCDIYCSTKTVLNLIAPRFKPGTIVVFDEIVNMGALSGLHEMRAWFETVRDFKINFEWLGVGNNSSVFFKLRPEHKAFLEKHNLPVASRTAAAIRIT